MWLVPHKKILTWDNIRKRGVQGPSRCLLCEAQEETMEHLLNNCTFTSWLWDLFVAIFQQSVRDRRSIFSTLINWRKNFANNEILNSTWALIPSFIIWNVWKDRNTRIFNGEKKPLQHLLELILKWLKETVRIIVRNLPKNPPFSGRFKNSQAAGVVEAHPPKHLQKECSVGYGKGILASSSWRLFKTQHWWGL